MLKDAKSTKFLMRVTVSQLSCLYFEDLRLRFHVVRFSKIPFSSVNLEL